MTLPRRIRTLLVAVLAPAIASACASRTSTIRVLPPVAVPGAETKAPAGTVEPPSVDTAAGSAIARTAETLIGAPYREGGALPDGFDCSGLVTYVFARNGIGVPRDVQRQAAAGAPVDRGDISPGDLVFFATAGSAPTHVGIALGRDQFIHAPKSGDVVRVESMSAGYWTSRFVAARRVVRPAASIRAGTGASPGRLR